MSHNVCIIRLLLVIGDYYGQYSYCNRKLKSLRVFGSWCERVSVTIMGRLMENLSNISSLRRCIICNKSERIFYLFFLSLGILVGNCQISTIYVLVYTYHIYIYTRK